MKRILILAFTSILFFTGKTLAQSGDLEVISIDPEVLTLPKGQTTNLILAVAQNGPGDLPVGSARVSISINTNFVNWVLPVRITDDCGNVWTVQTANPTAATPQIQLRNNNAPLVNNAGCMIHIPVVGVAEGTANITVSSTVFGPGVSDPNGTNQGATSTLVVTQSLPVTLSRFMATKENETAQLQWETTMETNSSKFDIERRIKGGQWSTIGSVNSQRESKSLQKYHFVDETPANGENLYRLKMIDLDGTFAYSTIRSLIFDNIQAFVYPNPTSDKLFIKDYENVKNLTISNLSGMKVLDMKQVPSNGIDIKHLSPGIHTVSLILLNGTPYTHKFVVSK